MPDIGKLHTVQQGQIHIDHVVGDTLRPAKIEIATVVFPTEQYTGETVFTPTDQTQIISINGKVATTDLVINPIPQNWGRITYNGYTITVS